jgi:hypothetical protein
MFEKSQQAGTAGNWQWGLDAGDHQERWNPYEGLASYDPDDHKASLQKPGLRVSKTAHQQCVPTFTSTHCLGLAFSIARTTLYTTQTT